MKKARDLDRLCGALRAVRVKALSFAPLSLWIALRIDNTLAASTEDEVSASWPQELLENLLLWWQSNLGGVALMLIVLACLAWAIRHLVSRLQAKTALHDEVVDTQLERMKRELADCRRQHQHCEARGRRHEIAFAKLHGYLYALERPKSGQKFPSLEELFSDAAPVRDRNLRVDDPK